MLIEVREQAFDPWQEVRHYQQNSSLVAGSYGACAMFVGSMRDFNQGDAVKQMHLTHYQGMTEHQLSLAAEQALSEHQLLDLMVVHRIGEIHPNDPIVLVAAWSVHRTAAFAGCRQMMEYLKSKATFWKKETLESKDHQAGHQQVRWVSNCN